MPVKLADESESLPSFANVDVTDSNQALLSEAGGFHDANPLVETPLLSLQRLHGPVESVHKVSFILGNDSVLTDVVQKLN